jgi:2-polyprenyl-3-methyl-5-hydroxy-6-metoxy-1,4-benzoquinol methylase
MLTEKSKISLDKLVLKYFVTLFIRRFHKRVRGKVASMQKMRFIEKGEIYFLLHKNKNIMKTKIENKLTLLIINVFLFHFGIILGQSDRETWQPPGQIMDSIGVKPEMIIGEAGAGRGYFTFPLAKRVGEKGKVYANDISTSSLDEIKARSIRENLKNIIPVLGETEDPLFPHKNHDMIIMVYVLHMLEKPKEFMENLKKYMTPETQLVIIERNSNTERSHYPSFMSKKQVLEMIEKSNFKLVRIMTFLPNDNIYIYKTMN